MVHFVYGGPKGRKHELVVDDSLVVVRTRGTTASARSLLMGGETRRLGKSLSSVLRLPHVGVEVFRSADESSEEARKTLKTQRHIRFAGRCLVDPRTGAPVLYTENLFVKFRDELEDATCRNELARRKLKVARSFDFAPRAYFVKAAEGTGLEVFELANELLHAGMVEFCHPELVREVRRRSYEEQWHLQATRVLDPATQEYVSVSEHANVAAAWPLTRGEGTLIAIIDDGVDLDHPEFARPGKIHAPRDATRGTADPRPGSGDDHGTACAGVACADGIGRASGAAPRARLMPIRLASGLGSMQEAEAFAWAVRNGADVISCSWGPADGVGLKTPLPDSTRLAIEYAVTEGRGGKGCVICWAAGNGNESVDDDGYASCPQVIAVGACNSRGQRSAYSDTGDSLWCCCPSSDGAEHLGIFTTDRRGSAGYNPGRADLGDASGDYTNDFGGTSSAAPLAAGIAALVLARNPGLRWEAVRKILAETATRIDAPNGQYDSQGHSRKYGYGRLDALAAVKRALPPAPTRRVVHTVYSDLPIQDLGPEVVLELDVAETAAPKRVLVGVDIEHEWRGDLVVRLEAPGLEGSVLLHDMAGGSAKNLRETWDRARIEELGQLERVSPAGKWRLLVKDVMEKDKGVLRSFHVELQY